MHEGDSQLCAKHYERCAIADVLLEAAHVRRKCLVGVVLAEIDPDVAVELGENPVVHAAHVVNQPARPEVGAARNARRPRHVPIDLHRFAGIEPHHEKVHVVTVDAVLVFAENLDLAAPPQVGEQLLGGVEDVLQFDSVFSKLLQGSLCSVVE